MSLREKQFIAWWDNHPSMRKATPKQAARAAFLAGLAVPDMSMLKMVVDLRFALGDEGKRMQDELVQHASELRRDAEAYRVRPSLFGPPPR